MLTLADTSLDWALKHVITRGDTDIFPLPFEFRAIAEDWDQIKPVLRQDLDTWAIGTQRTALAPKHGLGLRMATQLDPLDTLVYCALIYEVGSQFEAARVPVSDARVFSYRFLPDAEGQLYDPQTNYEAFRLRSLALARRHAASLVVMTDIADFFPRVYQHPMENAMRVAMEDAGSEPHHARVLTKLISAWNMGVSYGIPIGPSSSRLISEVTIADVDQALLSEPIEFCRFSDDYRLFVSTEREARESLAFLANVLYRNHGLTLQESKTEIVPARDFIARFERAERDKERRELRLTFADLIAELDLDASPYEPIEYKDLNKKQRAVVNSLNLWSIVEHEAVSDRSLDIALIRFVLRRITQLGLRDQHDLLLTNISRFAPVFREVVEALVMQSGMAATELQALGARLIGLFDHPAVGHLEYHREWLLTPFANQAVWNNVEQLVRLHTYHDEITRRAITLALGRGQVSHWFKTRKQDVFQGSSWNRCAFLYAASCLPGDEAKHWYQSLKPRLEPLDQAVVKYARAHPLR